MKTIIKVEFLMDFTPDTNGKLTTDIKFSAPDHPDMKLNDKIRRLALEQVAGLTAEVLRQGLPS